MNAGEYRNWMGRAFLMCEGALASELATLSRLSITEDYIRSSIVRGLILANPASAERVAKEANVSWFQNQCIFDANHVPVGRPIQHDVFVAPNDVDAGLACEVKWLTQAKAKEVAQDIWKLALSRSTQTEASAMRTYLLLGGESKPFADCIESLRKVDLNLRWSRAGRGGDKPRPTTLSLERSLDKPLGFNSWDNLICWGTQKHRRKSPDVWSSLRASTRERWFRTVLTTNGTVGWRMVLWELDHRGVTAQGQVSWLQQNAAIQRVC